MPHGERASRSTNSDQHSSAAFEELVRPLTDRLFRTALLLCGDWQLAEDLVQTALATFYARGRWHQVEHPQAYLRQSVTNGFLSARRRRSRREVSIEAVPESAAGHWHDAGSELRIDLFRALAELNTAERAVVVLRYWDDLSVAETAQLLGCSAGAVRTRSGRALAKLRVRLHPADLAAGLVATANTTTAASSRDHPRRDHRRTRDE